MKDIVNSINESRERSDVARMFDKFLKNADLTSSNFKNQVMEIVDALNKCIGPDDWENQKDIEKIRKKYL